MAIRSPGPRLCRHAVVGLVLGPLVAAAVSTGEARADDWHPYLFSSEGRTLRAATAAVESGFGYNGQLGSVTAGAQPEDSRQFTAWASGAVGIVDRVEAAGTVAFGNDPGTNFRLNQVRLDLRVQVLKPLKRFPVAITLGAGYTADSLLQHGASGTVAVSANFGRVDLTLNVRGSHYFHAGRDPLDVYVSLGALVRATPWLRAGAEYVGEELEALTSGDVEDTGTGRHYVGPTAVVNLWKDKLRLSAGAGPVFERGHTAPMARTSLGYVF